MDFKRLTGKAKNIFEKRGGSAAAKEDLGELKDIAGRNESLADKAKDAAAALKDPGAPGTTTPDAPPPADAPPADRP
jgi:hypothetical protein